MRDLCDWSLEPQSCILFESLSPSFSFRWDLDAVNPSVSRKEDGTVTALIRMIFLGLTVL